MDRTIKRASTGIFALSAAIVLAGISPAQAQQTEVQALRAQIEELVGRLEKLEADNVKAADAAAAAKSSPAVTSKSPVVVSGLLQVHSLNYLSQDRAFARNSDTFRLRRGELRLTAPSITSRISGTIMIDPAKAASNTAAAPLIRARDSVLQEIQLSYLLNKKGNNSLTVDVGQYKIPIGYESLQSSSALPLVERALIFTQRDPFDGGYGDVRDTGIQLRGTSGQISYRLGVFNGLGDRQNTLANSDPKAILGLVSFKPKSVQGLEVGVSGGKGSTGNSATAGTARTDRSLFNLFAAYKKDKLTLQSEYLKGDAQLADGTGIRDIAGYYGLVGYQINKRVEAVFRYDSLDTNRNASGAKVSDLTLGLNYYLKGNNAKIQTNIVRHSGAAGASIAGLRPDRTELRTAFQVAF